MFDICIGLSLKFGKVKVTHCLAAKPLNKKTLRLRSCHHFPFTVFHWVICFWWWRLPELSKTFYANHDCQSHYGWQTIKFTCSIPRNGPFLGIEHVNFIVWGYDFSLTTIKITTRWQSWNYLQWVRAKDFSLWRRANAKLLSWNSSQWPIYVNNSVDNTYLPCYTLPLTHYFITTVMDHEMTKITFCLLFWMILMDGGKCDKNTF